MDKIAGGWLSLPLSSLRNFEKSWAVLDLNQ
jgi:hypothetical protein